MKLVLANNRSDTFVSFFSDVQGGEQLFDYAPYASLLFYFETNVSRFINMQDGRSSDEYDGVYLNGYLSTPEIAVTAAQVLEHSGTNYVNRELAGGVALTKLSATAKLAAQNVSIPRSYGGAAQALIAGIEQGIVDIAVPFILKRADADRGIDNLKLDSYERALEVLRDYEDRSLWILQEFIPNDGFYLVSYYDSKPEFSIFRSLEERKDGKAEMAHMFKPKGGANASLLEVGDIPAVVLDESNKAIAALNRQIGSVDSLYNPETKQAYVLEVNYNPQLVTIETFKDVRIKAFIEAIKQL